MGDLRKKLVVLTKSLRYGIRKSVVTPALYGMSIYYYFGGSGAYTAPRPMRLHTDILVKRSI